MKKAICTYFVLFIAIIMGVCGKPVPVEAGRQDGDTIYQVSLLQGLTFGDYHGNVTVKELKRHGNIGIGTFDKLNGELILLDGVVYRAAGDGSVEVVSNKETIPFSNVTYLDADKTKNLKNVVDYKELCGELNKLVEERGKNRFYMIRIDGLFKEMNVRSVNAQEEPYKPLVKVLEYDQTFFDYKDIEGSIVGLYCPPYMSSLNAVGWHMHFISKDKTRGGHILGLNIVDAKLTWDDTNAFQMLIPQNKMFTGFDLTIDQSEDIKKVETDIRK